MMDSENEKPKTLDYTLDFPKLPDAPSATSTSSSVHAGVWSGAAQPAIKSSVVTEAFKLSADERASRSFGKAFGTATEEQQKCNIIAQVTGEFFFNFIKKFTFILFFFQVQKLNSMRQRTNR